MPRIAETKKPPTEGSRRAPRGGNQKNFKRLTSRLEYLSRTEPKTRYARTEFRRYSTPRPDRDVLAHRSTAIILMKGRF